MAELRPLRDELAAAASTITRISQDLSAGLVKADEGAASLRTKVAELEAERSSMLLRLQALETRNTELCKLLERNQPDLTGAIRARDAALKKLHLMREVVHDLIDERRQAAGATGQAGRRHHSQQAGHGDSSASSGGESWGSLKLTDVESSMGEDNDDVARGADEDSATVTGVTNDAVESSASAGKTSTDTGQRSALSNIVNQSDGLNSRDSRIAMTSSTRKSTVLTNSTKANILEATGRKPEERPVETSATSVAKEIKPGRRVANCGPSKVSKRDTKSGRVIKTITPDAPKTSPPEIGWYLEFKKPPATALRPLGPLTFQMLKDRLALDDDTMLRIESWGSETVNANVKRYLTNGSERPGDAVFQLFDAWYYLGGHKLLASDVPSIWHTTSNTQDKRELIEGLRERWTWLDAPNAEQVARRVETHELGQCSIELQSEGLQERSQAFVRQHFSSK
ncbi:uncharacterized protein B0H18DRAFT_1112528 [Fomitopsis serialis]|uniref:uncharacterized protein n=1 Tax=Fomitopsis serialis TaxID=139415 RepID=UPI00200846E2|nr:uncharacterized protein B0H18DRAFT_1112528 [Neoantrodia serialis]KAH9938359.1 hypothetical protein B0H18DRAFT_1112528 [Neoantrodia serialis]